MRRIPVGTGSGDPLTVGVVLPRCWGGDRRRTTASCLVSVWSEDRLYSPRAIGMSCNSLILLVSPEGLEPSTPRLKVKG